MLFSVLRKMTRFRGRFGAAESRTIPVVGDPLVKGDGCEDKKSARRTRYGWFEIFKTKVEPLQS